MTCDTCSRVIDVGDWPFCPHGRGASTVVGDEMDEVIENNGTPHAIRFRSKAALAAHMAAHNRTPFVRHIPLPGSDKSPHTSDWSRGVDAYTLEAARILTSRAGATKAPPADVLPVDQTVRTLDTGFTVKVIE